jgi:pyruvate/2-oxoglutarate dehydrogenase complex dihydrolipoamide acyltransferase (E2) component
VARGPHLRGPGPFQSIPQPQSAILGVGKLERRPVARERSGKDVVEVRPMCYVTLTIDHRVLDGFQANAFLARWGRRSRAGVDVDACFT